MNLILKNHPTAQSLQSSIIPKSIKSLRTLLTFAVPSVITWALDPAALLMGGSTTFISSSFERSHRNRTSSSSQHRRSCAGFLLESDTSTRNAIDSEFWSSQSQSYRNIGYKTHVMTTLLKVSLIAFEHGGRDLNMITAIVRPVEEHALLRIEDCMMTSSPKMIDDKSYTCGIHQFEF